MDRAKVIRGLRIAWTAVWGIVFVLLVALWVRSYWRSDVVSLPITTTRMLFLSAVHGVASWEVIHWNDEAISSEMSVDVETISEETPELSGPRPGFAWDVARGADGSSVELSLPYWFIIGLFAVVAALPWLRRQFSLRTLLIATTLIALGLGLVMYAMG